MPTYFMGYSGLWKFEGLVITFKFTTFSGPSTGFGLLS